MGYEFDSETRNYYAYARYYNPRLGRFMSPDPLGGNVKLVGNAELLFPPPFLDVAKKSVRFGLFFDAGNVFNTDSYDLGPRIGNGQLLNNIGGGQLINRIGGGQVLGNIGGGQVIDSLLGRNQQPVGVDLGDLRYSVGVGVSWLSPIGALTFSLAKPLNDRPGDDVENFQFNFGKTF